MTIETVTTLLGLVVAVMFLQALTGLVSGLQDLSSKLITGHIIYTWAKEKSDTICDTTTNAQTGAYTRMTDKHGHTRLASGYPEDLEEDDAEYQQERDAEPDENEWKSLFRKV